jgi:sulfate/thiosulfate transport system permease protein
MPTERRVLLPVRVLVLLYLGALLLLPVAFVFRRAFEQGVGEAWTAITSSVALDALGKTLLVAAIAVPANAVLGVGLALLLVRGPRWLRAPLGAVVSLPLAVPPVVIGLSLLLLYGRNGWLAGPAADLGIRILFSWPGMTLATIFISLPFVAREVVPLLREVGTEQEDAARTLGAGPWQTFRRITFPGILPAVAYGVVLTTARSIGEFGAVSIVSGRFLGQTQTLPVFIENRFSEFDPVGAYAASVVLAVMALLVLALMISLRQRKEAAWRSSPAA